MRRSFSVLLGLALVGLPLPVSADQMSPHTPLSPPIEQFIDEDSEARQAEVGRQVIAFLGTLQTHWGESQESLRRTVTGTIERDERGALIYSHTMAGHGILEGYEFQDSALVRGQYLFLQQPARDLNEFIEYYGTVKRALISAYGVPVQDQMIWENNLYESLPDHWGVAVQMGHLRFSASWETPEGTLSLELIGHHHSRLTVDYRHRQTGRLT